MSNQRRAGESPWQLKDEDLDEPYSPRALEGGDIDIARVAALVADHARGEILLALVGGRAMTASRLAATARITPATASSHLKKLTDAGFLKVEAVGRERFYRLSGPRVAFLIETLEGLAPAREINSFNEYDRARALRAGRACYDHIGGRLGVAIMHSMLDAGHLCISHEGPYEVSHGGEFETDYVLSSLGEDLLSRLGISAPIRSPAVRYCVDWSENRHHLSGSLGRALFRRMVELGWLEVRKDSRALKVRPAGVDGLEREFGLQVA